MSAQKVIETIKKYSKFLITSHLNLEGDALGSNLALASLLRKLGKTAYVVTGDKKLAGNYSFLYSKEKIYHKLNNDKFEAVFILDCPNRRRIGALSNSIGNKKLIINIDHHKDNEKFGQINWVDPEASSTGEMIYRLFKLARTKLNRKDAHSIYTAILTDTGSFRHANTTGNVFSICSKLLELGIKPVQIYTKIYENNTAEEMALTAKMASKMCFAANNKIAWVKIDKDIYKKIKGKHEIFDKILSFGKSIKTVKVMVIFSQTDGQLVKVSLRSKTPVDVQKIASFFGGGGHKFASGCTIKGSLKEAEKAVLKQVKKAVGAA